ncbi:TPA: response regulator [Legionella feeleii]
MPGKASILELFKNKISCTTLLLVEDNSIALQMIELYAEKLGCHCTSVTNGEDALEIAKSKDFDLIITDIGLPRLSGNELTRRIRVWEKSLNKSPKPIIGLAARGLFEAESESKQAGMNHVLSKPIKLEVLKSILAQFLPERFVISSANKANKQVLAVDTLNNYLISIFYSRPKKEFKL